MPDLSAVQRAMLAEIQKDHPNVTADVFAALTPDDVREWLDKQTGVATQPGGAKGLGYAEPPHAPSIGEQVTSGAKDAFAPGIAIAKSLPEMAGRALIMPETLPGRIAGALAPVAKKIGQDAAQTFLVPTPSDSAYYANGGVDATMAKTGLPPNLGPTQSEDEFRRAALATGGQAAMATGTPLGVIAGSMAQTPDEPYRGLTSGTMFAGLPLALRLAEQGKNALAELTPAGQANARLRTASQTQAGGAVVGDRLMQDAARAGKADIMRGVNISPELGAEGDFALLNSPKARATQEAALGKQGVEAQGRLKADARQLSEGRHVPEERLKELGDIKSELGNKAYAAVTPGPQFAQAAQTQLAPLFEQPFTRDALADADKLGMIGTDLDPFALARSTFEQDVAKATQAQQAWDQASANLFPPQKPGVLYGGTVSPKFLEQATAAMGPRPEIPTEPPPPSPQMLHHIAKRMDQAISEGYQAGGAKADLAARLEPVHAKVVQFLNEHATGFPEATKGWAQRSALEEAIAPPRSGTWKNSLARIPSAEEVWAPGFNGERVQELMHQLSTEPVSLGKANTTTALAEFQDAMAAHLREALNKGQLTADKLTPEALAQNADLTAKVRAAFASPREFNAFTHRAALEARAGNFTPPSAGAKPPLATTSWFSKYLPQKLAYKFGGKKYTEAIASRMVPELFTPGRVPQYTLKPIVPAGTAAQQAAAFAAMLASQQGKP